MPSTFRKSGSVGEPQRVPGPRHDADLSAVVQAISDIPRWLIVTHERPDGDAIGSALAIACILEHIGKEWTFVIQEAMPSRFDYLPHFQEATYLARIKQTFSHVIAVDAADRGRFTYAEAAIEPDAVLLNIDHHQTNPRYGTLNWVDSEAAATCELVFHLANALHVELRQDLAKCLYTGLLTDTGGFAQPNTTREVHQIAAELLASGVQPYDIAEPALEARTWNQTRLLQEALNTMELLEDGLYARLYVTNAMLAELDCTADDAEGLVGLTRSIDTVEVGTLFRERDDGKIKVSFRSKRWIDVTEVAQLFGGGGHARAAGCELDLPMEKAMSTVYEAVQQALSKMKVKMRNS